MFVKLKFAWVVVFILWVGSQFIVGGETCDPGLWARFTGCPVAGIVSVATVSEPRGDDAVDYAPVPNGRGGDFEEVPTYEAARASLNVVAASVNVNELARLPTKRPYFGSLKKTHRKPEPDSGLKNGYRARFW